MRNGPLGIDRVATKPATQLIMDAAIGHAGQRFAHDLERCFVLRRTPCLQAKFQLGRMWKLRRTTEASVFRVEALLERGQRLRRRMERQQTCAT